MKKTVLLIPLLLPVAILLSCQTSGIKGSDERIKKENAAFLRGEDKGTETFRVLLSSDEYRVVQLRNESTIERVADPGGDKYMQTEMEKHDMFDEVRTGVITVWLFPDSGAINKIRTQRPINFTDIDSLINDDIMRWNFRFPKKVVEPSRFDIVYRVVLRKKLSDEEILNAVQEKIKEGQ